MKQREVWNKIAPKWQEFRQKPHPDIGEFVRQQKGLILDVGCGNGRNMIKGKKYVGFDFAENQLIQAKKKAEKENIDAVFVIASADKIPFKDNTFDAVVVGNVIHTMESNSRKESVKEIKRVMKSGAKAIISVWNKNQPRFFMKPKESYIPWKIGEKKYMRYYYLFGLEELKKFLEKNGFKVLEIFGSKKKAFKLFPMDIIAIIQKT